MPPFYYFGLSIENSDILVLLLFALWAIVPVTLMYKLLSKAFIKLATTKYQAKKVIYHEGEAQVKTVYSAPLRKEIGRFLNTPIYLMNSGMGFLIIVVFGVYCGFAGTNLIEMLNKNVPDMVGSLIPIVILILSFSSVMSITTPVSISLEGKHLWILKSSPVRVNDIFNAKIMMNIILGVGSLLIADVCILYVLKPNILQGALIVALPIAVQVFSALQELACNLCYPKLDFTSKAIMVKQSISMIVAVFVSMGLVLAEVIAYFALNGVMSYEKIGIILLAIIVVLCVFVYRFILAMVL